MLENIRSTLKTIHFTMGDPKLVIRSCLFNVAVMLILGGEYLAVYSLMLSVMNNTASFMSITGYALLLAVLTVLFYIMNNMLFRNALQTGYGIAADLRTRLSDHLRKLPLSFFKKNDTAQISGRFLHDMTDTEAAFCTYLHDIASYGIIIVLYGAMLCIADMALGLTVVLTSIAALPVIIHAANCIAKESGDYIAARSLTDKTLLEYLTGIGELKAACLTGARFSPWYDANRRFRDMALSMESRFGMMAQVYLALLDASFVVMLLAGSWMVSGGYLALPIFLFFMLLSGKFYQPMQDFGSYISEFRFVLASLKRIAAVLREDPLPHLDGYTPPKNHDIAFEHVAFGYGERRILQDLSFDIPEGTVTALVGESGSGKSTTANLLLRFWDVQSGRITIGGTDIRTFTPDDFYRLFSVVFQEVYLFNDTVMSNIRLARPDATDDEVRSAARKACCHDFIMSLEQGYQTMVGEKGSRLSGGERQRIAIARAILKDAPILILDEATASIDPENELFIQQGLTNLMQGKTMLVIAHRLSTIKEADQILVLRDGAIAERGSHEQLIKADGFYRHLWQCQEKMKSWNVTAFRS